MKKSAKELIGVKDDVDPAETPCLDPSLKTCALMFDRVAIPSLNLRLSTMEELSPEFNSRTWDKYVAENRWLQEKGFIFQPNIDDLQVDIDDTPLDDDTQIDYPEGAREETLQTAFERNFKKLARFYIDKTNARSLLLNKEYRSLSNYVSQLRKRLVATRVSNAHGVDALPVFNEFDFDCKVSNQHSHDVVALVLDSFPTPDPDTVPWEHIFEFRSDPDSRYKFFELRHWMREMSHTQLPYKEVSEKLEYLIHQYKTHLGLHKMKTKHTRVETIMVSLLESVEELVRLRPSKSVSALFRIKTHKIKLLEEELKLPGQEVAYIIEVHKEFRNY